MSRAAPRLMNVLPWQRTICADIVKAYGKAPNKNRKKYNTIQCGHPPYNEHGMRDGPCASVPPRRHRQALAVAWRARANVPGVPRFGSVGNVGSVSASVPWKRATRCLSLPKGHTAGAPGGLVHGAARTGARAVSHGGKPHTHTHTHSTHTHTCSTPTDAPVSTPRRWWATGGWQRWVGRGG